VPTDLPLSTGPTAAAAYRRGRAALLRHDHAGAAAALAEAIAEDPCFAVGHAGLALALAELDDDRRHDQAEAAERARTCSRRLSRWERHHVEVVVLALRRHTTRASALGREHLTEFPEDALVRLVLSRWCDS